MNPSLYCPSKVQGLAASNGKTLVFPLLILANLPRYFSIKIVIFVGLEIKFTLQQRRKQIRLSPLVEDVIGVQVNRWSLNLWRFLSSNNVASIFPERLIYIPNLKMLADAATTVDDQDYLFTWSVVVVIVLEYHDCALKTPGEQKD